MLNRALFADISARNYMTCSAVNDACSTFQLIADANHMYSIVFVTFNIITVIHLRVMIDFLLSLLL